MGMHDSRESIDKQQEVLEPKPIEYFCERCGGSSYDENLGDPAELMCPFCGAVGSIKMIFLAANKHEADAKF